MHNDQADGDLHNDETGDNLHCYVRQSWSICAMLPELSRGLASHIFLFIGCTAIHNCSSLGSLVFTHLGSMYEI